jgi:hypothetical protein
VNEAGYEWKTFPTAQGFSPQAINLTGSSMRLYLLVRGAPSGAPDPSQGVGRWQLPDVPKLENKNQ